MKCITPLKIFFTLLKKIITPQKSTKTDQNLNGGTLKSFLCIFFTQQQKKRKTTLDLINADNHLLIKMDYINVNNKNIENLEEIKLINIQL